MLIKIVFMAKYKREGAMEGEKESGRWRDGERNRQTGNRVYVKGGEGRTRRAPRKTPVRR